MPQDRSKIDPAHDYCIRGAYLQKLDALSQRLNQPHRLTMDERRDAANMLCELVSEAFGL